MVRSSEEYQRVLLCVYPDVDLIKSCDPDDTMFSSDETVDREETMDECQHLGEDMNLDTDADWTQILDNQPIVLNDRMMTDAVQSPHIQSEHSYSLTLNDEMPQSPFGHNIKLEDYGKDMETDCFPAVSMTSATGQSDFTEDVYIKQEPASPPPAASPRSHNMSTISSLLNAPSPPLSSASSISSLHPQSLLKPTIVLATRPSGLLNASTSSKDQQMLFPKVNIKVEPQLSTSGFPLPPTPPSCNGSDSDGSLSPVHGGSSHHPSSPPALLSSSPSSTSSSSTQSSGHTGGRKSHAKVVLSVTTSASKHSSNSQAALISSQPKGATGVLLLTDEEKRTLLAEGYPIPQRLPLTKAEERSLKKIRRKIKNKISAQESRRKKKEYMDALEKKVEVLSSENSEYKKKVDTLEVNNKSLLSKLKHLEAILNDKRCDMPNKRCRNAATQTFPSSSSVRQIDSSRSEMSTDMIDNADAKGR